MKTKLFALLILITAAIFSGNYASAQNFRINGYAAYTLDDDVEASNGLNYYKGTVKGNLLWGAGLEYELMKGRGFKNIGIEISYQRQDTDVPSDYVDGTGQNTKTFKLGANYIMLGLNNYMTIPNSRFEPFAGGMLGLAIIENKEPLAGAESSTTKFSWGLKAGVNIMATKQIGLKLQAQLLSAVQSVGGGLYLGTGGTSAGLNSYSSMLQLGFGGGLTIRLGKNL